MDVIRLFDETDYFLKVRFNNITSNTGFIPVTQWDLQNQQKTSFKWQNAIQQALSRGMLWASELIKHKQEKGYIRR